MMAMPIKSWLTLVQKSISMDTSPEMNALTHGMRVKSIFLSSFLSIPEKSTCSTEWVEVKVEGAGVLF